MTDQTTPEPMTDIDPLRLILRLLDEVDRLRAQLAATAAERNEYARAAAASREPATATGAPGPDPSEGTAPTSPQEPTQGPHEAPCLDSPAPITLAQAATALHDWAGDLAGGARTDWPAGHADVIRGIRAAADWLDARAAYETEAREQAAEPTWRDVKLAAHRAGYRVTEHKSFGPNFDHWRIIGGDTGKRYVTLTQERGEWKLSFSGPSGTFHVRDITPARVLAAARLAGLIGDTDGK